MSLAPQALHDMHDVCGLVLQFRPKGDMISIWNRNATMDEATISRISAFYHSLLGLERSTIQYQVHPAPPLNGCADPGLPPAASQSSACFCLCFICQCFTQHKIARSA